jgi:hypothetical protein
VKINRVGSPAKLGDALPILLALGLARILRLEAVEPAALVGGVEHTGRNQCVDPSGEFVRAGE